MWNMSFVFAHHSKLSSAELIFPIGPEGGASESASALLQGGSERPLTGCVGSRCGRSGGLSYKTRDPTNRRARLSQARVVFPCLTAASSPRYSSERNRESPPQLPQRRELRIRLWLTLQQGCPGPTKCTALRRMFTRWAGSCCSGHLLHLGG